MCVRVLGKQDLALAVLSREHEVILCAFDFIRQRLDYQDFCTDEHQNIMNNQMSWLCRLVVMGRVSVTISYSFPCLTTETVKYTNGNSFIENLAALITVCGHREGKND